MRRRVAREGRLRVPLAVRGARGPGAGVGDHAQGLVVQQRLRNVNVVVEHLQLLQRHPHAARDPGRVLTRLHPHEVPDADGGGRRRVDDVVGVEELGVEAPEAHPVGAEGACDVLELLVEEQRVLAPPHRHGHAVPR
eukprot:2617325-Rhodomonas_salina.1